MRRGLFSLAWALCLLLCVYTAVLWVRSYHVRDRCGLSTSGGRYTVHSYQGRFVLTGPPPPAGAASEASARQIVAGVRNRDIYWEVDRLVDKGQAKRWHVFPRLVKNSAAARIGVRAGPAYMRSLLLALDDPDRFVAAHVLLSLSSPMQFGYEIKAQADGEIMFSTNYLRVTLLPGPWDGKPYDWELDSGQYSRWCEDPKFWRADPAQWPAMRDWAQDLLDVRLGSCPHWLVLAAFCAAPALRMYLWLRGRSRSRQGACPA